MPTYHMAMGKALAHEGHENLREIYGVRVVVGWMDQSYLLDCYDYYTKAPANETTIRIYPLGLL